MLWLTTYNTRRCSHPADCEKVRGQTNHIVHGCFKSLRDATNWFLKKLSRVKKCSPAATILNFSRAQKGVMPCVKQPWSERAGAYETWKSYELESYFTPQFFRSLRSYFVVKSLHSLSYTTKPKNHGKDRKKRILKIDGFQSVILPLNNLQTCHLNT